MNLYFLITFVIAIIILSIILVFFVVKYLTIKKTINKEDNNNKDEGILSKNFDLDKKVKELTNANSHLTIELMNMKDILTDTFELSANHVLTPSQNSSDFEKLTSKLNEKFVQGKNYQERLKDVLGYCAAGKKTRSKFIMSMDEFKQQNGWHIVMSLLSLAFCNDISEAEKQSWFSNFGYLKSLFYNFASKHNEDKNIWLVFEQKILVESPAEKIYRPDLLIISRTKKRVNIIALELKQWSDYFIFSKLKSESQIKESNHKFDLDCVKQINNYSDLIYNRLKGDSVKVLGLGYTYNATSEGVNKLPGGNQNVYSGEKKEELKQRLWAFLHSGSDEKGKYLNLEKISQQEVQDILLRISGSKK